MFWVLVTLHDLYAKVKVIHFGTENSNLEQFKLIQGCQ